jgi:hypothetical protein
MQREMNEMVGNNASGSTSGEQIGQAVGSLFGTLFSAAYPILALVFLKRKPVTDYLARHGT